MFLPCIYCSASHAMSYKGLCFMTSSLKNGYPLLRTSLFNIVLLGFWNLFVASCILMQQLNAEVDLMSNMLRGELSTSYVARVWKQCSRPVSQMKPANAVNDLHGVRNKLESCENDASLQHSDRTQIELYIIFHAICTVSIAINKQYFLSFPYAVVTCFFLHTVHMQCLSTKYSQILGVGTS